MELKAVPFTMDMLVDDLEEMAKDFNENTNEHVTLRTAAAYIRDRENPHPLTLEELRERVGKPVFARAKEKQWEKLNGWYICEIEDENPWLCRDNVEIDAENEEAFMEFFDHEPKESV